MEKEHLGGSLNKTNTKGINCLNYLKNKFNIKTLLDVGCGPGGIIEYCKDIDIDAFGLEGDSKVYNSSKVKNKIKKIDFSEEKYESKKIYDLVYSHEFLEHVDEKYMVNYLEAFKNSKYVLITAAPEGWTGHHHVNCQNNLYWIKKFNEIGLYHYPYESYKIRKVCNKRKNPAKNHKKFIVNRGLFFINLDNIKKSKNKKSYKIINNNDLNNKKNLNDIIEKELIISENYKELNYIHGNAIVKKMKNKLFESNIPLVSYIK
tara:strand:+ start:1437 stop:2219 length:783 start_codon:yes stop_codon:yes gene_type:complete